MPNLEEKKKTKKSSLNQQDVPSFPLNEALRVAKALADELAKNPSSPLHVAAAMKLQPSTSKFRVLASASIAFGLTEGSAWADKISLTPLGKRVVAPTIEGEDSLAKREALMRPRVIREFLQRYSGNKWPREDIGRNVLEEYGIPTDQAARALELIHINATDMGLITKIGGAEYVNLEDTVKPVADDASAADASPQPAELVGDSPTDDFIEIPTTAVEIENKRVFITHGKQQDIVKQIKVLLEYGEFEPVIAVESQSNAVSISDKVMESMRSCAAAIIHVNVEGRLMDKDGIEHQKLNDNVLIEIGAALALYGHKFILLVEDGAELPSNLSGLYQVRYKGSTLDHESTLALLKAFAGFKQAA